MKEYDFKLIFLYSNLINSKIFNKNDIPTPYYWKNNSCLQESWNNYKLEIKKNDKFIRKILIENDFYKYMLHLESHYT